MHKLTLIGAYGRVYNTRTQAARDWANGKDFKVINGPYCSIRDIDKMNGCEIEIVIANGLPLSIMVDNDGKG